MSDQLPSSIRAYLDEDFVNKRFVRPEEAAQLYQYRNYSILDLAYAADALYQLPVITLIKKKQMEEFMSDLYKIPGTGRYVKKKFVRIGEGSIMYSIGRHRFIEMARDAGAVYKVHGIVMVSIEIFDKYMEQFREDSVPMKHSLYKAGGIS